ncbi:MAG: JAB domain-containing protein [Calditrichaeota bacterium]|nr:JAB domain-containing protein [Calditrichota bacterium]
MKIQEPTYYRSKITDWPEGERPREKLMQLGPEVLTDSELVAILLRTGSREQTAVDLAKTVLRYSGGLKPLAELPYQQLYRLKGVGPVKAVTLIAAFELARRLASYPGQEKLKITEPEVVFRKYGPILGHLNREVFLILILNSANILLRDVRISEGILNASLVHPREVFRPAILESAASIILVHNHPSGETSPSPHDRSLTNRLVEVGKLLDIPVLDHVIIGRDSYFSFQEQGLIEIE